MPSRPGRPPRAVLAGSAVVGLLVVGAVSIPALLAGAGPAPDATSAVRERDHLAAEEQARAAERAALDEQRGAAIRTAHARLRADRELTDLQGALGTVVAGLPDAAATLAAARAEPEVADHPPVQTASTSLESATAGALAAVSSWAAMAAQPLLPAAQSPALLTRVELLPAQTQTTSDVLVAWRTERDRVAAERERLAAERERLDAERAAAQADAEAQEQGGATGAGPDCGGPQSREASSGGGTVFYTSTPSVEGDGSNGRVPRAQMAALGWCRDSQGNAQWLRADAAAALTRLNAAFRERFGENIAVDLSYRSYETQVAMREHYGSAAARPGTSNHGWGTAFDTWEWAAYAFGSARYEWLVANGPAYGWAAPTWARQDGSNPEYWHFEYQP